MSEDHAADAALAFRLVGLLADETRRRVVAALVLGARTLVEVEAATALDTRRVVGALGRLESAGLVDAAADGSLVLQTDWFESAGRSAATAGPDAGDQDLLPDDVSVAAARVLRAFLRNGRLVSIPAARNKRLVILDYLAALFEPGRTYTERTVNLMLGKVHPDVAALRRYLVDEGFLDRRDGVYWRVGGTFELD